jgi:hypothetical protein
MVYYNQMHVKTRLSQPIVSKIVVYIVPYIMKYDTIPYLY